MLYANILTCRDGKVWRPKKILQEKDHSWKQSILTLVMQVTFYVHQQKINYCK
jgi:hypothetical protein